MLHICNWLGLCSRHGFYWQNARCVDWWSSGWTCLLWRFYVRCQRLQSCEIITKHCSIHLPFDQNSIIQFLCAGLHLHVKSLEIRSGQSSVHFCTLFNLIPEITVELTFCNSEKSSGTSSGSENDGHRHQQRMCSCVSPVVFLPSDGLLAVTTMLQQLQQMQSVIRAVIVSLSGNVDEAGMHELQMMVVFL